MRDLRSIGVTEKINKNNAFKMLRSLCQVVRALGYTGLALLFDEGDRMLSVGGKSEKVATDNLREVIDRCREDLPGAMFMYAVPPAFITRHCAQVSRRSSSASRRPTTSRAPTPSARRSTWTSSTSPTSELLTQIGYRLLPIFEIAYGIKLDPEIQAANIARARRGGAQLLPGDQPPPPVHQGAGDRVVSARKRRASGRSTPSTPPPPSAARATR